MQKEVTYKGNKYTIEIKWGGSVYCIRVIGINHIGFQAIPSDCLNDIEKIKPYIVKAIEHKPDLHELQEWDGKL
jgi:hypothetical protein